MATIDLTLDSFKVPAIENYTPPFGTKIVKTDANKGGLSTVEVNSNIMMPFANMRPKVITENSSTTEIEYDAKLCFSSSLLAGATLELDDGAYEGCRVQITNLSSYTCIVEYSSSTLVSIPTGANVEVLWTGSTWMLSTTGTIASGNVMPPTSSAIQEYIKNQNILSDAEPIALSGTASYDGIIIARKNSLDSGNFGRIQINVNDVVVSGTDMYWKSYGSDTIAVQAIIRKGDTWSITQNGQSSTIQGFGQFYKLRDYTNI